MQFAAAFSAVVGGGIDIGAQSLHLSLIVAVCSPKSIADDNSLSVCLLLTVHSLSFSDLFLLPMIYFSLSLSFLLLLKCKHIHLLLQLFLLLLLLFTKLTFSFLFYFPFTTSSVDSQSVALGSCGFPLPLPFQSPLASEINIYFCKVGAIRGTFLG